MAVKIPADFNVKTIPLDVYETFIRDVLGLDITDWAKFRHTIAVGNESERLKSLGGAIPEGVKDAYRNLAKSHYEVVTALGCAKLSELAAFNNVEVFGEPRLLMFTKSLRDCYFHFGRVIDNLARLIYILNDPNSTTDVRSFRGKNRPKRYFIDWGLLPECIKKSPASYKGFARLLRSKTLGEILHIRHAVTHDWLCPIWFVNDVPYWPLAIRTQRNFLWYYEESRQMSGSYRRGMLLQAMVSGDMQFIALFQSRVFAKLIRSVRRFELTNNLVITDR